MTLDTALALVLFALVTSITPGPNNTMLFTSGVNFGFRRTLPHMLGVSIGFLSLLVGVGLGLGALLHTLPLLYLVLKVAGAAYLCFIAYKIFTATALDEARAGARPMTLAMAASFQWVNPKAWMMAVNAMATYADTNAVVSSVLLTGLIIVAVSAPSALIWTAFGSVLRTWLSVPGRLVWFNRTMAILLVLSLWPMLK